MNKPNDDLSNQPIAPAKRARADVTLGKRGLTFKLAALGLTFVSALGGTGLAYWLKNPSEATQRKSASQGIPPRLFQGWNKPDLVVILTAQQHGYMMPCGCSYPQVGGLERRYNFIQLLKERGWPVVAVDLGDVPQKNGPAKLPNVQGLLKYRYSMMGLKEIGYLAVGIGEYEGALSVGRVEGEWAANSAEPAVLASNLNDVGTNYPFLKAFETQTPRGTNIKVGVISVVGPTVAETIKDPAVKFVPSAKIIPEQLKNMQAANVDLPILLYHGLASGERREAIRCAEAFPQFPVVLCASEEDEPPGQPVEVKHDKGNRNYVFRMGHKGKYIGVLGVYRNGTNFSFKYQLVEMSTDFDTPEKDKDAQPIMKMVEDYKLYLKKSNVLKDYGQGKHILQAMDPVPNLQNPGEPQYIGSDACGKCHEKAYDIWKASKHSHAYETLVQAKHPSNNQFDGECIVCHTVGFGYNTGFTSEQATPKLINVGCENCHGPGSLHAKNPKSQEWRERMNLPWLEARKNGNQLAKNRAIEKFCVTCHDIDNDVTWIHGANNQKDPFVEKWIKGKIIHNDTGE